MLAFQVLGVVSPVTYSVASLIKRIAVVTVSILWFGQKVSAMQQFGIVLTFGGLYIYDKFGGDKVGQKKYANISLKRHRACQSKGHLFGWKMVKKDNSVSMVPRSPRVEAFDEKGTGLTELGIYI